MKRNLSILGILMAALLSSCSSSDTTSDNQPVLGQWKLINVSGSFAGVNYDFAPGVITWTFDSTTQTVSVINNNTDPNAVDVFETGVYDYEMVHNSQDPNFCSEVISINGGEIGCVSVVNDTLIINEAHVDGYTVSFVH